MEFDYLITRIDINNNINITDILITPLRWLVNGNRYQAIRVNNEGINDFSHAIAYEKSNPLLTVVKRIIGLIGTIVLFPVVCIGLAFKAYHDISKENYVFIASIATSKNTKFLCKKAFSIAPKPIPIPSKDEPKVAKTELIELVELWSSVGDGNINFEKIKNQMQDWLTKTVPNPDKYNYISQETAPAAAEELQHYLKVLILELKDKNDFNLSERVIIELANASEKCSPTWLEVAKREYQKLKCGNVVDQQLLQYLREVKEDLIIEFAEKNEPGSQWHVINYARWIVGNEFGLDRSHLEFDAVIEQKELENYSKTKCREIFYSIFKLDEIIKRVQGKIELEHAGTNESIQFYGPSLSEIADKHAISSGVDIESDEYDSQNYSMETFFDLKGTHYTLNSTGVEALLEMLSIIQ